MILSDIEFFKHKLFAHLYVFSIFICDQNAIILIAFEGWGKEKYAYLFSDYPN